MKFYLLTGFLFFLLVAVFYAYLRRISREDFVPPNAMLLIDAWNQFGGNSFPERDLQVTS